MIRALLAVAIAVVGLTGPAPADVAVDECCARVGADAGPTTAEADADTDTGADTDGGDRRCPGPCTSCLCCLHAPAAPGAIAVAPVSTFSRIAFVDPAPIAAPEGVTFRIDRPPRG